MKKLGFMILACAIGFLLSQVVVGQANRIKIAHLNTRGGGFVPGQMVELVVEGLPGKTRVDAPEDHPDVIIVQHGVGLKARVKLSFQELMPASLADPNFSDLKTYKKVIFTVPDGLVEGEASISVGANGQESDPIEFRIGTRPPRPSVSIPMIFPDGQPRRSPGRR